jgi:hypothetical protein
MIADLQNLYSGLKDRAVFLQTGGATIEPMMLAAVFGVGALAGPSFAYTHALFPRATANQQQGSSSSCGSSCNSVSCGSSDGGSGCGGGGCGGGCGGCGG